MDAITEAHAVDLKHAPTEDQPGDSEKKDEVTSVSEISHHGFRQLLICFSDMIIAISKSFQQLAHTFHNVWLKEPA